MSKRCVECGARCCKYFSFEIDKPDDYDEFENIRWFLMHEDVSVHVDDGDWYISITNRCKMLSDDNRCTIYDTRPTICREYEMSECDFSGGDYGYDDVFNTPEEIEAYARKTLGEAAFEAARAKAWANAAAKAENKKKK